MISIETTGLDEHIHKLKAYSAALRDLTPAYKKFAAEIVKKTDDSFQNTRGYDGEPWEGLAESTILARIGAIGAANKYTASSAKKVQAAHAALKNATPQQKAAARAKLLAAGWTAQQASAIINFGHAHRFDASGRYQRIGKQLTKGAQSMRDKMLAPGGIKPLVDTARARNSNHATTTRECVEWTIVGYLGYSMSGTEKMPERNPSPFYWDGSQWKLRDSAMKSLGTHLRAHILSGGP